MRFFLEYKFGILQTKTERIDVNFCQDTTQLLTYLEKKVQQASQFFIVKFKRGKNNFRLCKGWNLQLYGLKQGTVLYIELIQKPVQQKAMANTINNRYLSNVLGLGLNMADKQDITNQIVEEKTKQQQQQEGQFNLRKYLDQETEKMLVFIQKGNMNGFLNIFQDYPDNIEQEVLVQLQEKKPILIDELGQKGWGALHYAIFCENKQIFNELLQMDIDVNKCTSDGWLPIQLAINLKSTSFIQALLQQPNLNLNLVTSRGSPLHFAAKLGDKTILQLFLTKEIDIHVKDNSGKTPIEVCTDQQCKEILKKYEQKKQYYLQYIKGSSLPISLTTIVKGQVMKVKKPFMTLKQRFLLVDPFQGSFIRYESKQDYPKKPKQITPLSQIKNVKLVDDSEKSWYMNKDFFYFQFDEPHKQIYACKFKNAAMKWVQSIKLAVMFSMQLEKKPKLISEIKKNELVIEDKEFQMVEKSSVRKTKRNIFTTSMSSSIHLSMNSAISHQSDHRSKIIVSTDDKKKQQKPERSEEHSKSPVSSETTNTNTVAQKKINQVKQQRSKQNESLTEQLNEITTNKVNFSSFTIINTLGSGAFGKVFLVKHNLSGNLYALKALKKKNLILQKQLKYAIVEANILKQANHPFIINLHYAFQTPHYLYLALDYCPGKDLSFHLARQVTFPQEQARFYIAELILAIQHLHNKKIIYRDLKPQNILLDQKGHIRLADFGLSKETNDEKTKSFCGSPAYLSPQMLSQKGAGKQSDLYGIGAVLYQFIIGQPPYFSEDIPTLYRNIKQGRLKFPKNISQQAKNVIIGLLERDPKKRLGAKGIDQIKEHSFFSSIDWLKLQRQQCMPPKRPQFDDQDVSDDQVDIIRENKGKPFTDFDYDDSTKKINRLLNFSFIRKDQA